MAASPWLKIHPNNGQPNLRLFCFPYAGGSALIFRRWSASLPKQVEVCPIELPGRGRRIREASVTRMHELIPAIASAISGALDTPFALFGHSLGASIAFELAGYLKTHFGKEPAHLFVSGNRPPHLPRTKPLLYNLPEAEFSAEVARLNGTPLEILDNADAMAMVMPILRADFELIETYRHQGGPLLACPIRAFGGLQDPDVLKDDLSEWKRHTAGSFSLSMMRGDHFFITQSESQLLSVLSTDLEWISARQYSL
jgi:medium-chain acyl-[acyl-carrier-protein] hydrolase